MNRRDQRPCSSSDRRRAAHRAGCRQRGSALLLVVGATAALGTLAMVLLGLTLAMQEAVAFRRDGAQARLLAESGVREAASRLATGELDPSAARTLSGRLPSPPAGFEPLRAAPEPAPGAGPGGGCGYRIESVPVRDADGEPRTLEPTASAARLVDVIATAWCGRGRGVLRVRLAVAADGSVRRLD